VEQLEDRVVPSVNPATPFQLDGNVTTEATVPATHDWDQVFADAGSPSAVPGRGSFSNGATSQALAGAFINDRVNTTSDDIFQGGGSKDTLGIQNWLFTGSKPQGKDDITHAYAAAYIDPSNGHLILYAGLDRFDNSGDSTAGFWFFGNNITENPNVTTNGGHPFVGTHQDGDILLVSDFTIGGSTSTIKVFRWTGNDATGSLVALNNGNPINGNTFAIVNSAPISVPWSYTNKPGQHQPQAGEFLEEGVDLTALGLQGCFSTFMAETRSSQSPTATLSDFALGSFPLCSLAAPQFSGLSKFDTFTNQGDLVTYPLTVQNTGGMPLYIQTVSDTLLGNIVVNHTLQTVSQINTPTNHFVTKVDAGGFNFSTPLAPGASLTINVTRQVQSTDSDPTFNTTTFTGTDDLAGTADPITTSVTDSVNLFQPSATLTEVAAPTAGVIGTPINYTFTVSNTSSSDSPNLILDPNNPNGFFTDSLFGNIEADVITAAIAAGYGSNGAMSLPHGASFSFTETRPLQATDITPLTDSASAGFTFFDSLDFPNIIHASASATTRTVNAEISIAGSGVNEINNPHTFTATVLEDLGDGKGFVAAGNVPVTITLQNTNGSTTTPLTYNLTTDGNGQASVTFTSATAGEVIGSASTTFTVVPGVPSTTLTRSTGDSNAGDSGQVTKFFEDANISISPNATNGLTEPHTFTVTVLDNAGDGKGYVAAANVPVTVSLAGQNGASPVGATPLSGTTDVKGQFQVTFTSDSGGQVVGTASTDFFLNGVELKRETGDSHVGDSAPATKTFVPGSLRWEKVDESGNLLGGATFLVSYGGDPLSGLPASSVTVSDNGPFDADPTLGKFLLNAYQLFGGSALTGLALGTYTVQETVAPTGYTLDPNVESATLTLAAPNADLSSTPFVDTLPKLTIVKAITPGFATVIHPGDTASYTITVTNTGVGTATNVVVTDALPDASQLNWSATSSAFSTSISNGVLTTTDASLAGGASASITVSAVVPLSIFGNPPNSNSTDGVPLGLFELDGNATTGVLGTSGSTTTSHDWDQVFADAGSPATSGSFNKVGALSGARVGSFVTDKINTTADDIFTGGGSKDTNGIQNGPWLFTDGKPQGKDDIEHAFAALYTDPTTQDAILYAGLDRFDNSGDSTAGFWFFVNPIGEGAITKGNGTGPFTGTHTTGDILLVSDFTQGGSVSTIRVFEWVGNDTTGSLVALNNGNPIGGKTFAIVNSAAISVPWSYTNKSKQSQPQAGEFLEEGVNLTSLGLNPCFSTFLAETRSSQSPTATLSDFVLGSFQTCDIQLPNTASVSASNFNSGQPINSTTVTIDLNDGMPQLANAVVNGTTTASLTEAQLQLAVNQAIAAWRAAGADPAGLSNVANYKFHIANLPDGELGWENPGQIWIDPTAQGWGWSTGSTPVPGQMDLLTVVTHEVGHMLGYGDHASGNDIMTTSLGTGMRRLPEALSSTDNITFVSRASDVGTPQRPVQQLSSFSTAAVDAVFAATRSATSTAITTPDRPVSQASVLLNLVTPAPVLLSSVAMPPAMVTTGTDRDSASDPVPGLWPSRTRRDGGNEATQQDDRETEEAIPLAPAEVRLWQRASDACFADDSWMPGQADTAPAQPEDAAQTTEAPAAAVLALAMAGWWGARPKAAASRKRQRLLIDSF
jgi:uncharacterized repeat protein (TIGR01451 family)